MTVRPIVIAGIGTGVGKTVVAAIFTKMLQGVYWKPIESGTDFESDTQTMASLSIRCHKPVYSFKAPLSPDQAAARENRVIKTSAMPLPETTGQIIIEPAGGLLVPLNRSTLMLDLLMQWNPFFVIVSHHYLGSINHTLLTIREIQRADAKILGIIFNGQEDEEKERSVLNFSSLDKLGNLLPENAIDQNTLTKYSERWKKNISPLL